MEDFAITVVAFLFWIGVLIWLANKYPAWAAAAVVAGIIGIIWKFLHHKPGIATMLSATVAWIASLFFILKDANPLVGLFVTIGGCVLIWAGPAIIAKINQGPAPKIEPLPPPTPHAALMNMRIAWKYYDNFEAQKDPYLFDLEKAARAIEEAKRNDPTMKLKVTKKDGTEVEYDQDQLAFLILDMEAYTWSYAAEHIDKQYSIEGNKHLIGTDEFERFMKERDVKLEEYHRKSIPPMLKALGYRPKSADLMQKLARAYAGIGDMANFNHYLDKALEIDPNNLEAFEMRHRR